MRLHVLGANGPFPESNGATSGYLLETENAAYQLDLGCGTLGRLTALMPPEDLNAILISHWHFDHTSDLLPLIFRLEAINQSRDDAHKVMIPVIGPDDPRSAIYGIIEKASCFELMKVSAGDVLTFGGDTVFVGPARHPVPAVGYRIKDNRSDFGYTGDTNTVEGLAEFYAGCHLLLADALLPESEWLENKPHLSAALAAEIGKNAGVRKLVLTHFNPVYSPDLLIRQARKHYPDVARAIPGELIRI